MNKQQLNSKRQWLSRVLASQIALAASGEYDVSIEQDIENIMTELDEINGLLEDLQDVAPLPVPEVVEIVIIDDSYGIAEQQQFIDDLDQILAEVTAEFAEKAAKSQPVSHMTKVKRDMWDFLVATVPDFPITSERRMVIAKDNSLATPEEIGFLKNLDEIVDFNLNVTLQEVYQLVNSTK